MNKKLLFVFLTLLFTGLSGTSQPVRVVKSVSRTVKTVVKSTKKAGTSWRTRKYPSISGRVISQFGPGFGHIAIDHRNSPDSIRRLAQSSRLSGPIRKPTPLKFPEFKPPMQTMDGKMAAMYPVMKGQIANGAYDRYPLTLFAWANFAKRQGDDDVAAGIMRHVDPATLTPGIVFQFSNSYPAIQEWGPVLANSLTMNAYIRMLKAKYAGSTCDTAHIQADDTLMIVTKKYVPYLVPLVELNCIDDPSKEADRYKVAADSVLSHFCQLSPEFNETFFSDFLSTLSNSEDYHTALDYFRDEPLKSYPDSMADFTLRLASCAWNLNDAETFNRYLRQAETIDSTAAREYWNRIYNAELESFIAQPSQTDVADWLLQNTDYPAEAALNAAIEVIKSYFPATDTNNWEWTDSSTLTPEQLKARDGIVYILSAVRNFDISNALLASLPYINFLKAAHVATIEGRENEALNILKDCITSLDENPSSETNDLHCWCVLTHACIAGHGLDKPDDALKILKKNLMLLDAKDVNSDTRSSWYDYMASLLTRIGNTEEAEKYLNMR